MTIIVTPQDSHIYKSPYRLVLRTLFLSRRTYADTKAPKRSTAAREKATIQLF